MSFKYRHSPEEIQEMKLIKNELKDKLDEISSIRKKLDLIESRPNINYEKDRIELRSKILPEWPFYTLSKNIEYERALIEMVEREKNGS